MTEPSQVTADCASWTDEYLLSQFALGSSGYSDARAFERISAEVSRRGLALTSPPPPPDLPRGPYVVRLWRGQVPLATTFWGWGVGGGFLVAALLRMGGAFARSPGQLPAIVGTAVFLLAMAALPLYVFVLVAVFRSAERYRGWPVWSMLAKVLEAAAVLGAILKVVLKP